VHTVPGPCAAIAALTIGGLPTDRFLFLGFLPARAKARSDAIAEVAQVRATLVIYESGQRLSDTLLALSAQLGDREAAVVRELTKLHEQCLTGTLVELARGYANAVPKGEIVIVVGPPLEPEAVTDEELDSQLLAAMAELSPSRAAAEIAERLNVPRRRAYARALELSRK
jgi:16S rRNA (cytidine1402-2'-O)-methyltransferase